MQRLQLLPILRKQRGLSVKCNRCKQVHSQIHGQKSLQLLVTFPASVAQVLMHLISVPLGGEDITALTSAPHGEKDMAVLMSVPQESVTTAALILALPDNKPALLLQSHPETGALIALTSTLLASSGMTVLTSVLPEKRSWKSLMQVLQGKDVMTALM